MYIYIYYIIYIYQLITLPALRIARGGRFQLELGWEASVASRQADEPLGADQGERRMLRCQVGSRWQELAV